MLPDTLPRLVRPPVTLRAFERRDLPLVVSVADDALIPLITTVPASGTPEDAFAYIKRQHDRLATGAGYSFAIADSTTDEAVGQIGLWTGEIEAGRASTGYWVASQFRRRGYMAAALTALTKWALRLEGVKRLQLFAEPWNEGSWCAAEAAGYQPRGCCVPGNSWAMNVRTCMPTVSLRSTADGPVRNQFRMSIVPSSPTRKPGAKAASHR